jgi:hypothetical protein
MSTDNFHNSAEKNNEQEAFNKKFDAFKKLFTIKLDDLGVNTIAIEKSFATTAEQTEKFKLGKTIESHQHTHNSLDKLSHETNQVKQKVTNNINLEVFRLPQQKNALQLAQNILEKNGLGFVLDQIQKQTQAQLGYSCIHSINGVEDFA